MGLFSPAPHLFHNWVELARHRCKLCVSCVPLLSPSLWVLNFGEAIKVVVGCWLNVTVKNINNIFGNFLLNFRIRFGCHFIGWGFVCHQLVAVERDFFPIFELTILFTAPRVPFSSAFVNGNNGNNNSYGYNACKEDQYYSLILDAV